MIITNTITTLLRQKLGKRTTTWKITIISQNQEVAVKNSGSKDFKTTENNLNNNSNWNTNK